MRWLMHFVLAATTYNRLKYLREFWAGFIETRSSKAQWTVIIADDGSTDGTLKFLECLPELDVLIYNNRHGVAEQTNSILNVLVNLEFDVCFKCDDDMLFRQRGWDELYYNTILKTGYDHLCYDNDKFNTGKWCQDRILPTQIHNNNLIARVKPLAIKGCFWTITPRVLKTVGFMDSVNFFHGHEHTDYSMRCARAGFNHINYPFDAIDSNAYLGYRFPWTPDQPCLNKETFTKNGNTELEMKQKEELIMTNRLYIPYIPSIRTMK